MKSPMGVTTHQRGSVLVYSLVSLIALAGMGSLAVDYGHVHMVKQQLRTAADAAARAGASALSIDASTAIGQARLVALANRADGTGVDLDLSADIEVGFWDTTTRTFTKGYAVTPNAVHVIARRLTARGNGVKMSLASLVGHSSHDVAVESIAMLVPAINVNQTIMGTANPFLSGMPAGTIASVNNPHNSPDFAGTPSNPRQSPFAVPMPITEGQVVNFDAIDGDVRHDPNLPYFGPDGQLNVVGHNTAGSENGIGDVTAPINAMVGVFLSDDQPNLTPAPASLDFSTAASQDFHELKPQLKQIFFIGDGLDSSGNHQNFIAPKGATRLFVATWDFYEWNNNAGSRDMKITRPQQVFLVK